MQRLVHAYAPIYVRYDALPMQTRYVEHGRRETQHAFAMEIERGEQLPCCFDTPRDSLNIARIMHRISLFLTVLRLAQFRNSRYYGELESIKFVLLFEIMVENNGKLDFLLLLFKKKKVISLLSSIPSINNT